AAAYGASGVTAEGSPLDVLASSAYKAEMDRQTILYDGRIKAMGYEDQAALDRAKAGNEMMSGIGDAAGILMKGAGDIYEMMPSDLSKGSGGYPGRGFGYGVAGTTKSGQDY